MSIMKHIFKTSFAATLFASTSLFGALALPTIAQAQSHQITMQQADIRAFIDDVSMVTGKTFLVDPRVQGKVTISSDESLSKGEVFEVFKDVMRVHGYTLTRTATGEYRVTLLQGAAQDAPFTSSNGINGRMATSVLKLNYEDAAAVAKLIKPVLHSQGIVSAQSGGKIVVVTDFPENLRKAREIVAAMDTNGRVIETVQLRNLTALDAEDALKALAGARPSFKVVAMPGSNNLLLEGEAAELERLKAVLSQMDAGGAAFALGGVNGNSVPFIGTNFSRSAPNILALTGALADTSLGLNTSGGLETAAVNSLIGLDGGVAGGGGVSNDTLFAAILTAIETDDNSNILSTPFVTTLDNVPATFLVGQEIPITTGESIINGNANPFRSFERIPVGIQLDVLPQISEGDVIRLEIKQEVSSIAGALY